MLGEQGVDVVLQIVRDGLVAVEQGIQRVPLPLQLGDQLSDTLDQDVWRGVIKLWHSVQALTAKYPLSLGVIPG